MGIKPKRERKCDVCRTVFVKHRPMQKVCGPTCAEEVAKLKREKEERKKDRQKLQELKPLSYWEKRVERVCNAVARKRDEHDGCISCGAVSSYPAWHAGHLVSVGANSTLRYELDNIHKQCAHCNIHKRGNAIEYEKRLRIKIGDERVDWLKGWHEPVKRSAADLQELERTFKRMLKELTIKD